MMDTFESTRAFIRVDFPTLGRPIMFTNPDLKLNVIYWFEREESSQF